MARTPRRAASVGLFITSRAITAVQARPAGDRVEIVARGSVETPGGAMQGHVVMDPPRMGQAIRSLWRSLGLRERAAGVAVPPSVYAMRAMRLPEVPERERHSLVRGELEQNGAVPYGAGGFDFLWLRNEPSGTGPNQADVYAYYVSDSVIDSVREALRQAGLQLAVLEPASVGIMRAYLAGMDQRQPVALLCPAEKHSDLCVHDGHRVRHLRRIPSGQADLEQLVLQQADFDGFPTIGLTERQAKRPLNEDWVIGGESPGGTMGGMEGGLSGGPVPQPASLTEPAAPGSVSEFGAFEVAADAGRGPAEAAMPAPAFAEAPPSPVPAGPSGRGSAAPAETPFLVAEVARSLAFYAREHEDEARPRSITIVGPAEVARQFERILDGTQSIPVVAANVLEAFDLPAPASSIRGDADEDGYLTAIGVACGVSGADAGLPLLDTSIQESGAQTRLRAPRVLLAGMAGSVVWMTLSAVAAIALTMMETGAQSDNARLTQEIATLEEQRARALRYNQIVTAAKDAYNRSHLPASSVLGRVAAAARPGISVTGIQVSPDGSLGLDVQALDPRSVEAFVVELGQGRTVQGAQVSALKRDEKGLVTFRIVGRVRAPAPPPEEAKAQ